MKVTINDHSFAQGRTMLREHGWLVSGQYLKGDEALRSIRRSLHNAINARAGIRGDYDWGNTLNLVRMRIARGKLWSDITSPRHRNNIQRLARRLLRAQRGNQ